MNMQKQDGFTLIELVVVIVILGILAATALPRFIDLGADAARAAVAGVAGGLNSAAAINYSGRLVNTSYGTAVTNCQAVSNAMQSPLPTNYAIATSAAITAGASVTSCVLQATISGQTYSTNFTAIGA